MSTFAHRKNVERFGCLQPQKKMLKIFFLALFLRALAFSNTVKFSQNV